MLLQMASASAKGHVAEYIEGTMIWVNQNHLKNLDWQERLMPETKFITGNFVHTFTVHDTGRAGSIPDNLWWSQQSNVHAHIIAPVRLPKERLGIYPKEKDALMVVAFIPAVFITEADFPAPSSDTPHTRLMDCTSAHTKSLWIAVRDALEIAKGSARRTERRHVAGSVSMVNQGLRFHYGHDDDARKTNNMVQPTGTLDKPRKINVQKKLPREAAMEYDAQKPWPPLEDFLTNFDEQKLVAECDTSAFSSAEANSGLLLKIASEQLKTGVSIAIQGSPIKGMISAISPPTHDAPPKKAARRVSERTVLILNLDYSNKKNFFLRESLVHWVVWIIERSTLQSLLDSNSHHIVSEGHYRHVVNQSFDKRRIIVKPPMPEIYVNDGNKAFFFDRIHGKLYASKQRGRCV